MPRKLPKMKTPVEIRQEQEKKMTFSDKWEEELKKQLFEEENSEKETITAEDVLLSKTTIHKKRPGEEWDVPISEEIQEADPILSLIKTAYKTLQKMQVFLDNIDFSTDIDMDGRPLYKPKDVIADIKSLADVRKQLKEFEAIHKKDLAESGVKVRGDAELGYRDS